MAGGQSLTFSEALPATMIKPIQAANSALSEMSEVEREGREKRTTP